MSQVNSSVDTAATRSQRRAKLDEICFRKTKVRVSYFEIDFQGFDSSESGARKLQPIIAREDSW